MTNPERGSSTGYARHFLAGLLAAPILFALAPIVPGMWLWGASLLAHVPIGWAALWAIPLLLLVPPVGRAAAVALEPAFARLRRPGIASALAALAAAALVLAFPDRVRFVGDFLLRQGTAELAVAPGRLFPQALPIDVLLHYELPTRALAGLSLEPDLTNRLLGAVNAVLLSLAALVWARRWSEDGRVIAAAAALVFWGGWLLLFTGFSKAFAEMTWVLVAFAVLGVEALRGRRSILWAGLTAAFALWLHRSALGLLPALVFAVFAAGPAGAARAEGAGRERSTRGKKRATKTGPRRRDGRAGRAPMPWARVLALALPGLALVAVAPRLTGAFAAIDRGHFDALSPVGLSRFADPLRWLDVANLVFFLVPLVVLLPLFFLVWRRGWIPRREAYFLVLLAAPFAALFVFFDPQQGSFRDHDTFAASGVALALLISAGAARSLERLPGAPRWALATIAFAAVPVLLALVHHTSLERGLARVEAWVEGPPVRSEPMRAITWDWLGVRALRAGDYERGNEYFANAAELAPSPRILLEWAAAAEGAGDWASAERAFRTILARTDERYPRFRMAAYLGLAKAAARRGERDSSRVYLGEAERRWPADPLVRRFAEQLRAEVAADTNAAEGAR